MIQPNNIHDALRHIHNLTMCIAHDMATYLDNPGDYSPEYFESVKDAALDAHLLVTWIKDNITEGESK